jgi:ribokinase
MSVTRPGGQVLVAGSANVDFVVRAPHIPAPGETVLGGDLSIIPGGKGANQAVACARAGGAPTAMLAAMGRDSSADMLQQSLQGAGISLNLVSSNRSTGAALITVSEDAENAITVAPGANMTLAPNDLPDLAGVAWLVMQLETPLPTVTAFAHAAQAAGVHVILNASPAQAIPAELLSAVDVLLVNEAELSAIVGPGGSLFERLGRTGVPCAIVTLGARGCCALQDGQFVVQPAFAVDPVDTTGAGDTFAGVLAAALAGGEAVSDALRTAAAAAALTSTRPGAQSSIPEASEVSELLGAGLTGSSDDLVRYCSATPAVSE